MGGIGGAIRFKAPIGGEAASITIRGSTFSENEAYECSSIFLGELVLDVGLIEN